MLSPDSSTTEKLEALRHTILHDVIRTSETAEIINPNGSHGAWILDFRNIFLNANALDLLASLFWEHFETSLPFQVGGMESASIPLITAIVLKGKERGTPIKGFYIRKSRKKTGLLRQIEGEMGDEPVVLVDDLINGGGTLLKQIVLLEAIGKRVQAVFTVVRFRELDQYQPLHARGIHIKNLFTLDQIGLTKTPSTKVRADLFATAWYVPFGKAELHRVERKSTPAVDAHTVYAASDDGYIRAFAQDSGSERWARKIGVHPKGRYRPSNLICARELLYFATHNGSVYAVHTHDGQIHWEYNEADYCTSPLVLSPDGARLYLAINAGWYNKRNYLVALDTTDGHEVWRVPLTSEARGVPTLCADNTLVGIGCEDGTFSVHTTRTGALQWSHTLEGPIRGGGATTQNMIVVGSMKDSVSALDTRTGECAWTQTFEHGITTTPLVYDHHVIVSSLDKRVYCLDLPTGNKVWDFETKGRVFADPVLIHDFVYVGSDDSRLYQLDARTGTCTGFFQTVERITNPLVYCSDTDRYFLTTFANELYCLAMKAPTL